MDNTDLLKLSPFVLPQIRQGLHAMVPANLSDGAGRILYIQTLLKVVQDLIDRDDLETAMEVRNHSALAQHYIQWEEDPDTGKTAVSTLPEFENGISLRPTELGVLFKDGRLRDDSAMVYIPVGEDLPNFATLLERLHRGISRAALLALADELEVGLDEEVLDHLIERGVIEPGVALAPPTEAGSGVAWLGHAYVRAVSGGRSLWIDPYPFPRMKWTPAEEGSLFRPDLPDAFSLANYGPAAHHITQDELSVPDAVFITHQDVDHIDLGALALLPASVPIYVPEAQPDKPWQVDLVTTVKTVLGAHRNVRVMRHGETIAVGDMLVTALPFAGEYPSSLPHKWNCYYLELPNQVWALFADSSITPEHVELCRARRQGDARPFGVMTNMVHDQDTHGAGYSDDGRLYTLVRLYSWYLALADQFAQVPAPGLHVNELRRLVQECGASMVYPYAHGNLPWYRVVGGYLLDSHVGSHSLVAFERFTKMAASVGATVVKLRHGELFAPQGDSLGRDATLM